MPLRVDNWCQIWVGGDVGKFYKFKDYNIESYAQIRVRGLAGFLNFDYTKLCYKPSSVGKYLINP